MKLLYSNILPLGTEDTQQTIADCFEEQLSKADRVEIAVGYVSRASLEELDSLDAYSEFVESDAFERYPNPTDISESLLEGTTLFPEDQLPYQYESYFGTPDIAGSTIEIEIYDIRKYAYKYREIRKCIEDSEFPLMVEYTKLKEYYTRMPEY